MSAISAMLAIAREHETAGRLDEAAMILMAAAVKHGDEPELLIPLGRLRRRQGRAAEARELLEKAVPLASHVPELWAAMYEARLDLADYSGAAEACRRLLALRPELPEVHRALANMLLMQGELAEGWREYEWRLACPGFQVTEAGVRWQGEEPAGRTILVAAEQGFGDVLFAARFLPLLARKGARVILRCHDRLAALMRRIDGVSLVISPGTPSPGHDFWVPMMSLPLHFAPSLEAIPGAPYLQADPGRRAYWRERLAEAGKGRKLIGLAQAGNPEYANDFMRTPPTHLWRPLLDLPDCLFVGLLRDEVPETNKLDWGREAVGFDDLAALAAELDLVISVDTAAVHLAGGLGVPVWIAMSHLPDWRWLLHRTDSPWYPEARLFRQEEPGKWDELFANMAGALRES